MTIPQIELKPPRGPAEKQPDEHSVWLWPDLVSEENIRKDACPWLDPYPVTEGPVAGAVLIFPGGAYTGRAAHEGEPVADMFNAAGIGGFVVQYRVYPHRYPAALADAARALRILRSRAEEWNLKPEKVAVLGFSAGGHLAGSLATLGNDLDAEPDDLRDISCRPNACILGYPVVTGGTYGHRGSFDQLLGTGAPEELRQKLSLENRVTGRTPPSFLWHTLEDQGVPVENSLRFAQALRKSGVPYELHVFPQGAHGIGLAQGVKGPEAWPALCCTWLKQQGW